MRTAVFMGLIFSGTFLLAGCEWAITPDFEAETKDWAPIEHEQAASLVDVGALGPSCTLDQGDERPMVQGRFYVIAYCYGQDQTKAYALKDLLVERGIPVVVGHMISHKMYFVRSAKGFDPNGIDDREEMALVAKELTVALEEIYKTNPGILETHVSNMRPYAFEAKRP